MYLLFNQIFSNRALFQGFTLLSSVFLEVLKYKVDFVDKYLSVPLALLPVYL